jgi:hypothetical protein
MFSPTQTHFSDTFAYIIANNKKKDTSVDIGLDAWEMEV